MPYYIYDVQCNVCTASAQLLSKSKKRLIAWYLPHMRYTHGLDVHEDMSLHPRPEFESKVKVRSAYDHGL